MRSELEDGAGKSAWVFEAWTERPPREPKERREPRELREPRGDRRDSRDRGRGPRDNFRGSREVASSSGRKINPKDVVISVKY
jgi:hypothetical protein